jgi:hypothetical protein
MALIKDPPPWPDHDRRFLQIALGTPTPALVRDLAWVRWRYQRLVEFDRLLTTSADGQALARLRRRLAADHRQLRRAARALTALVIAGEALTVPMYRGVFDDLCGPGWPARFRAMAARLCPATQGGTRRRVGRPPGEAHQIAADVATVLSAHGIRPTATDDGTFARVLDVVLRSVNVEANRHGLVKAIVRGRRRGQ